MRSWGKAQPAALPGLELSQCDLCWAWGLCQAWGHPTITPWADEQGNKGIPKSWGSLGVPSPLLLTLCEMQLPYSQCWGHSPGPPVWAQHL